MPALASHGSEDVEPFRIGPRLFLAVACVRSGAGPYDLNTHSTVYEWRDGQFVRFQDFPTFAAKQWHHFVVEGRHFLAIANGVSSDMAQGDSQSRIYEWSGTRFEPFQALPSTWAYNWMSCDIGGRFHLGLADHVTGATLYRWEAGRFVPGQQVDGAGSRALSFCRIDGVAYLACANLTGPSHLARWEGDGFVPHQVFDDPGGREFKFVRTEHGLYLVRVNFLVGSRQNPITRLPSAIYRWQDGRFEPATRFETFGATDACFFLDGAVRYLIVSNSLSEDARFRVDSVVYRFDDTSLAATRMESA